MSLHPQSKLIFLLTRSLGSLIIVVVVQFPNQGLNPGHCSEKTEF